MFGLVPIFRLGIIRVRDGGTIVPIFGFLGFGVLDLLGWQEVPVGLQLSRLDLLVVDLDLVGVVGVDDESVEVREDVVLAADLFLDQMILSLVAEDDVDAFGTRAANVRSCN